MTSKTLLLTIGFSFLASAAWAENDAFRALDLNASGGLSFTELLEAAPDLTAIDFVKLDSDGSGDLSQKEFAEWKASAEKEKD